MSQWFVNNFHVLTHLTWCWYRPVLHQDLRSAITHTSQNPCITALLPFSRLSYTQTPSPPLQLLLATWDLFEWRIEQHICLVYSWDGWPLLGATLLSVCVSCINLSLSVAFSFLMSPEIVCRCSTDLPSQGANPINIQLERKITIAKIWEIQLGLEF